jgi:hypothetical protein
MARICFAFPFLLVLISGLLGAQDGRAVLLGRIADSSGAAVPSAIIELLKADTGQAINSKSNNLGNYEVTYLTPGLYTLAIDAPGFKKAIRRDIELRTGDTLRLDIGLEVGQVTESVTVDGETPLLEASSASLGQVTDRQRLVELPLSGGNPMTLLRLAPGINNTGAPNHPSLLGAVGAITSFNVNGTPSGNTQYTIDGAPAMSGTGPAFQPPAEMVAEFKITTSTYDAAAASAPGGNIAVVLKSGANQPHGSLYWFHNDIVLQGMDLFQRQRLYDPSTGPVTHEKIRSVAPQHVINRYGGSANGPVRLPGIYNGRNKTFWAFSFEGFIRPSVERGNWYFTVPTVKQRGGDFSDLLPAGASYQIYDPATIKPAANGRFSRQPFPGNVMPKSRLDPLALKLVDYWPLPNNPAGKDGIQNYFRPLPSNNRVASSTGKFDHLLSERQRLSGRFNYTKGQFISGQTFPNFTTGTVEQRSNRLVGIDDVLTLSPRMVLNLRANFTRYLIPSTPQGGTYELAGAGFDPKFVSTIEPGGRVFPGLQITGESNIGGVSPSLNFTNYSTAGGDLTLIRGNHTLRSGIEFRLYRENNYTFNQTTPDIAFGAAWTQGPLDNSGAAPIGPGLASYLLGLPTGGTMRVNSSYAMQSNYTGLFFQDDWKLSRRATLNVGLRYEYYGTLTERYDRSVAGFDFSAANPIDASARAAYAMAPAAQIPVGAFRAIGGVTFAGVNGEPRGLWDPSLHNFAPRIGVAFQPERRTSIRTGYGIYFFSNGADRANLIQTGFSRTTSLTASENNGQSFIASLANPFPNGPLPPQGASGGLTTNVGNAVSFFNRNLPNGYVQRWSFGIQRELPGHVLLDTSYVGNRGTHLGVTRQFDSVPAQYLSTSPVRDTKVINLLTTKIANPFYPQLVGTGLAAQTLNLSQMLRPYPQFTGISSTDPDGYTWYHSLQVRTERRFTQGLTAQVGYTWSKWMGATSFLNETNPMPEKVIQGGDRPQRLTMSFIAQLPFGSGRRFWPRAPRPINAIIGGWQVQGLYEGQSGPAIGFGDILFIGDIHKLVLPVGERSPSRWFNAAAGFEKDPAKALANNIRTFPSRLTGLRSPGLNIANLSATKYFQITEKLKLQFRNEWLNAMNHTALAAPNTTPTSSLFGTITSSPGFPRQIYFGLKLLF